MPGDTEFKEIDLKSIFTIKKNRNWKLDLSDMVIEATGKHWYEIDLDRCKSAKEILDWIIQVQKKSWATDEIVSDLVLILNDIIDIQGHIVHSTESLLDCEMKAFARLYVHRLEK